MKLIGSLTSPYVRKVRVVLAEKKLDYNFVLEDVWGSDAILASNPLGKVPVLVVRSDEGEVALFESNVICEYIEDTQGGAKLHPQDPIKRAEHRAWMEFGSAILSDLWGLETTTDAATFESKREAVAGKFARIEAALGSGPFFAGESFSLVDAVLLRPLPFHDPERLVMVWEDAAKIGFPRNTPAPGNYSDWKRLQRSFTDIAATRGASGSVTSASA